MSGISSKKKSKKELEKQLEKEFVMGIPNSPPKLIRQIGIYRIETSKR